MAEALSTPSTQVAPQAPRVGWPPRYWWLKRLCTAAVVLLAGLAGFHWWLDRHVDARLERIVEGWRADQEAPLPEMLLVTRGPPTGEENAAFHYDRAMTGLPALTQKQNDEWDNWVGIRSPLPPEKVALVREIVAAARPELEIARHARSLQRVDWNLPALSIMTSGNWAGVRQLAVRQQWAMILAHHDGQVAGAIECGRDIHHLGTANISYGPSLIAGLVSTGVHALAASQLINIAWHSPPGMTQDDTRSAWRAAAPQVRAVINDLLDEEIDRKLFTLSWKGERVMTYSVLNAPGFWPPGWTATPSNLILGPVSKADIARLLEDEDRLVAAAQDGDPTELFSASKDYPEGQSIAEATAKMCSQIMYPSMQRGNIAMLRACAHRRAAAIVLAAKLYHADHGKWPDSLEALVPVYLPHLPRDPFSSAAEPMRFRADTLLPLVYSVGEDLTDNGGSTGPPADAGIRRRQGLEGASSPNERQDFVIPLFLPAAYLEDPQAFNVWNWLMNPEGERQRLEKLKRDERDHKDVMRQAQQEPAED